MKGECKKMSRIKKCIMMFLALAVVLSVVQIPAFADGDGNKYYMNTQFERWSWNDGSYKNILNCWYNTDVYKKDESGNITSGPGVGGASFWTGNNTTMLGGQQSKVWRYFDNSAKIDKKTSFIVECEMRGYGGAEYVMGLTSDNADVKNINLTGALIGREKTDSKNVLKVNTDSDVGLNKDLIDTNGNTVNAPADVTDYTNNTTGWHKYKIYCDASKHPDNLYMDVTVTDVTDPNNTIVYQKTERVGTDTDGSWNGIFFMNNSTNAINKKLAEFKSIKVYTPDNFTIPDSNTLSKKENFGTMYKDDNFERWSWNDGSYKNILNCWYNTDVYKKDESGNITSGPGVGGASFWTGNNTTMLGGQQSKVWRYFDNSAKIDKKTSFIVECEMRGYGGAEYVMGLTSDNADVKNINLTGALIGREKTDSKNVLKVNTDSDVGLNKDLIDTNGNTVNAPADVTDYTNNTTGWHKYKIYCDASKHPDNLYMDVTVTDVTDPNNTIVYQKTERVGTDTDGSWNGIFFMNNSTNAINKKLAEFKSIKVYVPDRFAAPNTFSGSVTIKAGDSAVGDTVTAGTSVKAEADITNTAAKTGKAYLILAEYNSDDRVTAVKVKEVELNNSETQTVPTEAITLSGTPGGYVRAFLWTDEFRPICQADKANITAAQTVTE